MNKPNNLNLHDYLKMAKRRMWSILLPMLLVFALSAGVALLLPSIFRSTSTILIEEQEIPSNFVAAAVTSYAEQRLQSINQRIMSTTKLIDIIKRFHLYPKLKDRWTTEEIIDKMREDIHLQTISADVVDRRTGRPTAATIAFTLSYEGKNPGKVQKVANMLASLYLEENLKVRERQTRETYTFIEEEMEKVKADLGAVEAKIAAYKDQHMNELPEMLPINMQSLNNTERSIDQLTAQLRTIREREGYLQTQLASIPQMEDPDKKRLEELNNQLAFLTTRFKDQHPDVRHTRMDIEKLEQKMARSGKTLNEIPQPPDNPAYISLSAQLSSSRADIDSLKRQIADLKQTRARYQAHIENTPKFEQEYNALMIERNNTHLRLNDLMAKFMEARVAHGLETEQKGERFTLIDPARFPEEPFKPNRLAIILIGMVLGIGAGVGWAAMREFGDDTVYHAETLAMETGISVLGSIPAIILKKDIIQKRIRRLLWCLIIIALIAAGIAAFHFLVMDLDVFWVKLMRKIDRMLVL